ncbi:hypothetical protein CEQ90_10265 [Lewinellaceae bacterium SD302]|nr:hypothetical protein CEQ90_10265 [Lewinellaceae bacterium SD302]
MEIFQNDLFVHNAGLVILGAYLPTYFNRLGLLNEDDQFIDEASAIRGVHLLQYLASGQAETEEHLLIFNKILCGLDVSTPVPHGIDMSDEERSTSDSLLNAILQNWDKMSNSTVENLRATFLIRDSIINATEEHWELTVEEKGYDVLLVYIPWSISFISLPWMNKPVRVHWR